MGAFGLLRERPLRISLSVPVGSLLSLGDFAPCATMLHNAGLGWLLSSPFSGFQRRFILSGCILTRHALSCYDSAYQCCGWYSSGAHFECFGLEVCQASRPAVIVTVGFLLEAGPRNSEGVTVASDEPLTHCRLLPGYREQL